MAMFMSLRSETSRCPLCAAPSVAAHTPFCSRGCKDRDLLNWLGEAYRVPARPEESDEAETGLDRDPEA
jgi:endogenous inhibitor of DNA gyrase (YacG/DUF329 family)